MARIIGRTMFKILGSILLGMAILAAAGWMVFVPSAQEPPYEFVKAWGGKGSAPGQFSDPTGIAVAGDEVFVADSRNDRIQVFDHDGAFLRKWGGPLTRGIYGPFNGWFSTVTSIAFSPPGDLFVADLGNNRVQKWRPVRRQHP